MVKKRGEDGCEINTSKKKRWLIIVWRFSGSVFVLELVLFACILSFVSFVLLSVTSRLC
jgi:hypothetical protein